MGAGFWFDGEWPLEDFRAEFVEGDEAGGSLAVDEEGMYALRDHLYYMQVPPGSAVEASLGFPTLPPSLYVLQQARDLVGRNYLRTYWFWLRGDKYLLGSTAPADYGLGPRIESTDLKENDVVGEGGLSALAWLEEEVQAWLPKALSVAFVAGGAEQWEDRGTWRYR